MTATDREKEEGGIHPADQKRLPFKGECVIRPLSKFFLLPSSDQT